MHIFEPLLGPALITAWFVLQYWFDSRYSEEVCASLSWLLAKATDGWAIKVRRIRTKRGWTQEKLAEKIGVDVRTVQRWEAGTQKPHSSTLGLFYQALDEDYRHLSRKEQFARIKN